MLLLFSLRTKSILVASWNYSWKTDVTWTVLPMSLLRFWTWERCSCIAVYGGSESSQILSKIYLNLCSEDERRSYRFGTTGGWVINDRIFIFGWTNPLIFSSKVNCYSSKTGWTGCYLFLLTPEVLEHNCWQGSLMRLHCSYSPQ